MNLNFLHVFLKRTWLSISLTRFISICYTNAEFYLETINIWLKTSIHLTTSLQIFFIVWFRFNDWTSSNFQNGSGILYLNYSSTKLYENLKYSCIFYMILDIYSLPSYYSSIHSSILVFIFQYLLSLLFFKFILDHSYSRWQKTLLKFFIYEKESMHFYCIMCA